MNQPNAVPAFQLSHIVAAVMLAALCSLIIQQPLHAEDITLAQSAATPQADEPSTENERSIVTDTIDSDAACTKDATGGCTYSAGSIVTTTDMSALSSPTAVAIRDASLASNSATRMALVLLLAAIASLGWMIYQQNKSS